METKRKEKNFIVFILSSYSVDEYSIQAHAIIGDPYEDFDGASCGLHVTAEGAVLYVYNKTILCYTPKCIRVQLFLAYLDGMLMCLAGGGFHCHNRRSSLITEIGARSISQQVVL
ncbi:hypothetical protein RRG08_009964 [Elysia crispata]|uniref:Uncharacterized protein n=1 Tax=Elysia crispata TaxID=231223 RepID=A0AAE1B5V7_9GAST|nr:hypothetical protein RRG08_009964 [Elysia crispata]